MPSTIKNIIGLYSHITEVKKYIPIELLLFLDKVKLGEWQDKIIPIWKIEDEDARRDAKAATLPYVTIGGEFSYRAGNRLLRSSGFIAIDLDHLDGDVEAIKQMLSEDDYVFAVFLSASGRGLCVIFKIDGKKHDDAFDGIAFYLYDRYGLHVDYSCSDVSRPRYVSYDPNLYLNEDAKIFKKYLSKPEKRKIPTDAIFVSEDFNQMVEKLSVHNICEVYRDWLAVGFALAAKLGENGRTPFHLLSSTSSKYDEADCDKKYDNLLKSHREDKAKQSTIGTLFYFAKKFNIPYYSPKTQKLINDIVPLKNSGLSPDDIIKTLTVGGVQAEDCKELVENLFVSGTDLSPTDSTIQNLENWLRFNYNFKRNIFTRKIEVSGRELSDKEFNSIYVAAKKIFDTTVNTEMIQRVIDSAFTTDYNPFFEFYEKYADVECDGVLDKYISCFKVSDPELFAKFFKCWFVGIISSTYGQHNPLVLVLIGGQGNGKTETFRRLLPEELKGYYAESQLDLGKDDEILMTKKSIICDDEFGGKRQKENKKFKNLTSKQVFTVREPYGRYSIDLIRLASLCGTANEKEVLVDSTGNRRILPVEVLSIDFEMINKIDRIALYMEAHKLYKDGFRWELSRADIEMMKTRTSDYEQKLYEQERLEQYFRLPEPSDEMRLMMTRGDLFLYIKERDRDHSLNESKLSAALTRIGWKYSNTKNKGVSGRYYEVVEIDPVMESKQVDSEIWLSVNKWAEKKGK